MILKRPQLNVFFILLLCRFHNVPIISPKTHKVIGELTYELLEKHDCSSQAMLSTYLVLHPLGAHKDQLLAVFDL